MSRKRAPFGRKRGPVKPKSKARAFKRAVFAFFVVCVLILTFFIMSYDKRMLPAILQMAELKASTKINDVITSSVAKFAADGQLKSDDFYIKSVDGNGKVQSLDVNALLVDSLCAELATDISTELSNLQKEKIEIPLGIILGINSLANAGPPFSVKIQPLGTATVDYTSKFVSAGINQINLQIWLVVDAKMSIVNPLQTQEIDVSRTVPLINTVFSGEVPPVFFNNGTTGTQ